tara:strand:+ start:4740 stop:6587 length:1848 start_codon:yes stop_codon:yes gene_type:complete
MSAIIPISYFNSFWLKKTGSLVSKNTDDIFTPVWPGIFWSPYKTGVFPINAATVADDIEGDEGNSRNWFVEESRIKGGYNNTSTDYGVKAYLNEDNPSQLNRFNSIIYSGVFNSLSNFNETNVFSAGENITSSLDPAQGSIQKLFATDTNLIVFQENKVSKVLIDKDITYTSENGTQTLPAGVVLGQTTPFAGDYGISKNPESFASFGFRRYFTDRFRGKVLRLSQDGLSVISENGMSDFFRDQSTLLTDTRKRRILEMPIGFSSSNTSLFFIASDDNFKLLSPGMALLMNDTVASGINRIDTGSTITRLEKNPTNGGNEIFVDPPVDTRFIPSRPGAVIISFLEFVRDEIQGSYDVRDSKYTVSYKQAIKNAPVGNFTTPALEPESFTFFDEPMRIRNTSTLSFDEKVKGWTSFYTFRPDIMLSSKSNFYSIKDGELWKHYDESVINNRGFFYTVFKPASIVFVINSNPSLKKIFQTINYEGDNGFEINYFNSDFQRVDNAPTPTQRPSSSGSVVTGGVEFQDRIVSIYSYNEGLYVDPTTGQNKRAGFNRKENLYVANLVNNSNARPEEILFGDSISGIKGYFATVKISNDLTSDVGGLKELWSVGSRYVRSS